MGNTNNNVKKLGIKEGVSVNSDTVERLWRQYDKDDSDTLSRDEALKFLKDLCEAVHCKFSEEAADAVIRLADEDNSGELNRIQFLTLLDLNANQSGQFALTKSVQLTLDRSRNED
jgi:Ca2+-binding EF-hand superfamily protein